jgi:ribosomal protein S18 acetylase RimI-like enzyme
VLTVEKATEVTDDLLAAFAKLVPQLSRSSPPPSAAQLAEMIASPATTVLVARDDDGAVVGTLTLAMFRVPTGLRAIIEDVVVDATVRGQGGGSALTQAALAVAADAGVRTVDLTSRPSREAANRLYVELGFHLRETNVYRYDLASS